MTTVEKKYPKGTTKEQWDKYEIDKAKHDAHYDIIKPKRQDYEVDVFFTSALSRWSMDKSMDSPNEPGYYRANND